jgi:hypothetical protein
MIVQILDEALAEANDAQIWYESRKPGLGGEFSRILHESIKAISQHPRRWPREDSVPSDQEIRFVTLQPFSYSLVYKVGESDLVLLAVAHLHQRPGYWRERLKT